MSRRAILLGSAIGAAAAAVAIGVVLVATDGNGPKQADRTASGHNGMVTGTVWVANEGSGSLTAIDAGRNEVVTTLTGINGPHNLQVSPDGRNVWESGYIDSNGDMADLHSLDVAAGRIKKDQQLVHFQTKFLTTNVKGTDREMYLPVNFDIDPLPHLRPPGVPTTVLNHPPLVRMENHSLPPLGERVAKYKVPGKLITKPGKYRLAFRMRSRAEPIYFMRFVGSTKDMEQSMNERIMNFHAFAVEVEVKD